MPKSSLLVLLLIAWVACGDDSGLTDAGRFDSSTRDGGTDSSLPDGGGDDSGADDAGMTDGGMTDAGDMDAGPMDAGPMCPDDGVDDGYMMATDLGEITDDAGYPYDTAEGDIFPITDQDWYVWHVTDELFADVDPRAGLSARPVGVPWELCLYFQCDGDTDSVGCEGDGTPHSLVEGEIEGCCAVSTEASTSITLAPSCDGLDDSGNVYVRISRQSGTATCEGYTLTWGDA